LPEQLASTNAVAVTNAWNNSLFVIVSLLLLDSRGSPEATFARGHPVGYKGRRNLTLIPPVNTAFFSSGAQRTPTGITSW
jgi:hypothetical protein